MINPNMRYFETGHITEIKKHTSMTTVKVWIMGSNFEYTSFNYNRRLKINDNVRCKIKFSIVADGFIIEDLKKVG